MSFFPRFILSILLFGAGLLLMKYSVAITDQFSGKIDLAEKYLGTGIGAGTYSFWKLFGLSLCIIAVLWMFNKLPHSPAAPPPDLTSMLIQMLL